jgi:hypothetical protein
MEEITFTGPDYSGHSGSGQINSMELNRFRLHALVRRCNIGFMKERKYHPLPPGERAGVSGVTLWACLALWALAARPDPVPFSRYQVILDRKPFGEPPPVVAPPQAALQAPPVLPQNSFIKDLRMCAITETDTGVRVGIINVASKPQKSYFFLLGGEGEDGIQLVDADYQKEGALLRKGAEEFWIYMDGNTAAPSGAVAAPAPAEPKTTRRKPARRMSYAERLRQRRADELARRRKEEIKNRLTGEALEKHLKAYQMDVIRKGMPALPIPLTKEMDDTLVAEGVLPPLE